MDIKVIIVLLVLIYLFYRLWSEGCKIVLNKNKSIDLVKHLNFKEYIPKGFRAYNPSICLDEKTGDLYYYIRLVNKGCGDLLFSVVNHMLLIKISKEKYTYKLIKSKVNKNVEKCDKSGIEDIRLYMKNNELYGIGNHIKYEGDLSSKKDNYGGSLCGKCKNRMLIIHFDKESLDIKKIYKLYSDYDGNEKNWSPIIENTEEHRFIYNYDPMTVISFDLKEYKEDEKNYINIVSKENYPRLKSLRGSSQVIFDEKVGGWISIGHTRKLYGRTYNHKFVVLNKDFSLRSVSEPFCMNNNTEYGICGIQFVSGMTKIKDQLYITYGDNDCHAKLSIIKCNELY